MLTIKCKKRDELKGLSSKKEPQLEDFLMQRVKDLKRLSVITLCEEEDLLK